MFNKHVFCQLIRANHIYIFSLSDPTNTKSEKI